MGKAQHKVAQTEDAANAIDYNGPAMAAAALDAREQPDFNDPEREGSAIVAEATRIADDA